MVAAILLGARPGFDLTCHYQSVAGKPRLVVSRDQWEGIRSALYKLDRKVLASLVSEKLGVIATSHSWGPSMDKRGRGRTKPWSQTERLTKTRFLNIGDDSDFVGAGVSTATKGDTLFFKWFWVDLATIALKHEFGSTKRRAYDQRVGFDTWEIYGWVARPEGGPSSSVTFGAEGDHLIIRKIEMTMEPD